MTPALRDVRNGGVDEISDGTSQQLTDEQSVKETKLSLANMAHAELSELLERCDLHKIHSGNNSQQHLPTYREAFPLACKSLLHSLPGNRNCIDCNARDPEWAAISYGALVCIKCSGKHRSMGVAVSQVRSVAMDHWTYKEVVLMLEGGNAQLGGFFERHVLTKKDFEIQEERNKCQQQRQQRPSDKPRLLNAENVTSVRYKTKAALFYKNQLEAHVGRMLEERPYRGRPRRDASERDRTNHQQ